MRHQYGIKSEKEKKTNYLNNNGKKNTILHNLIKFGRLQASEKALISKVKKIIITLIIAHHHKLKLAKVKHER